MLRNFLIGLILIFAITGCGQINVNIDPKSSSGGSSVISASKSSSIEVTAGSSLKKVTSLGYKVTTNFGSPYSEINQVTTPNGYKVRVGVTGLVAYGQ